MRWYNIAETEKVDIRKKKKYKDVFILDEIGGYGVYAKNFIRDLSSIDSDVINLHIDSVGGSITDGIAIYNALRGHPAQVDIYINGIAASIASVIILAGDNVYIPENAGVFTHLPMLGAMDYPNRKDLMEAQESLSKFEQLLTNIYVKHTGADEATVKEWMENDTWFFGQEAVDAGFATAVVDKIAMVARLDSLKNYAFYASLPQTEDDEKQETKQEVTMKEEVEVIDSVQEVVAEEVVEETSEVLEEVVAEVSAEEVVAEVAEQAEEVSEEVVSEEVEVEIEIVEEDAEEALALEQERKQGILAISQKYNSEGMLDSKVIEALAGDVSVDEFKDIVLDAVVATASSKKLEVNNKEESDIDGLRKQLASIKDPAEKASIARKIRSLR
jgi:ATP-dependent protease ClpP protease subunit